MTVHKFKIGQRVRVMHGVTDASRADSGRFTVTRQMPGNTQGLLYRIKGDAETHERMVQETQLEALF
jgi:hypothetical protein